MSSLIYHSFRLSRNGSILRLSWIKIDFNSLWRQPDLILWPSIRSKSKIHNFCNNCKSCSRIQHSIFCKRIYIAAYVQLRLDIISALDYNEYYFMLYAVREWSSWKFSPARIIFSSSSIFLDRLPPKALTIILDHLLKRLAWRYSDGKLDG